MAGVVVTFDVEERSDDGSDGVTPSAAVETFGSKLGKRLGDATKGGEDDAEKEKKTPVSLMENPLAKTGFGDTSRRVYAARRNAAEAAHSVGPQSNQAFTANDSEMTEEELADMTYAFQAVDMDNGGYLDIEEFGTMLAVMGCEITPEQVKEVFSEAKNGFVGWLRSKDDQTKQHCRDVWSQIDWDMSGDLGAKEINYLVTTLRHQGFNPTGFSDAALRDGVIDFHEFSEWFVKQDGFTADFGDPPGKARGGGAKVGGLRRFSSQRGVVKLMNKVLRKSQRVITQMALAPIRLLRMSGEMLAVDLGKEDVEHEVRKRMRNPEQLVFAEFVYMMRAGMLKSYLKGADDWRTRAEDMRKLREAFDTADVDGNNQLRYEELELVVHAMNARAHEHIQNEEAAIRQIWTKLNPEGSDWIAFEQYCKGMSHVRADPALQGIIPMDVPQRFQLLSLLVDSPINEEQEKLINAKMNPLERFGLKMLGNMGKQQMDLSKMKEKLNSACQGQLHFLTDPQRSHIRTLHFKCVLQAFLIGTIFSILPGLVENQLFNYYETDGKVDAYWTCPGTDQDRATPSQWKFDSPFNDIGLPVCPFGTCTSLPLNASAYQSMGGAAGGWTNVAYPLAVKCGLSQESSYFADCARLATPQQSCVGSTWRWCTRLSERQKAGCSPLEMTPRPFSDMADGAGIGRVLGFNMFNIISIGIWVAIELALLMYTAVRSAILVSKALDMRLIPLNEDRAFVGSMLVRAAFEMPDIEGKRMGVDNEVETKINDHWLHNLLAAAWYKGKTFIMGQLLLQLWLATLPYEHLITLMPYLAAGVATAFWDTMCCHYIMKKAERRAIGVTTSIEVFNDVMDTYCPNYEQSPGSLSEVARVQILRAIGIAIVRHGSMHPNMELLLRHAVEYLGMKKSRAVHSPGIIDNQEAFKEDFASLTLAETRAVLCIHMLGYVLDGNIEAGESKFWFELLNNVEVLHQAKKESYKYEHKAAHVRWFITREAPWLKEAVDAVPVPTAEEPLLREEEDAAELEELRKLFPLPERATIAWPERHNSGSAGPVPSWVCQRFRYNHPVTTKMLLSCFDPIENATLRKTEIKTAIFHFNEFTWTVMRIMMATF